jgi:hypothetical protein
LSFENICLGVWKIFVCESNQGIFGGNGGPPKIEEAGGSSASPGGSGITPPRADAKETPTLMTHIREIKEKKDE